MNQQENSDWKSIAHDEFENRKSLELKLTRLQADNAELKSAVSAANSYNQVLAKRLQELEGEAIQRATKLKRSIELLKNAKVLFARQKQQILELGTEKQDIRDELLRTKTMLESEISQHENTRTQLAQALHKLTTAVAVSSFTELTATTVKTQQETADVEDVIFADDMSDSFNELEIDIATQQETSTCSEQKQTEHKQGLFRKIFGGKTQKQKTEPTTTSDLDANFIEQMLYFEKQINKQT